MRADAGRGIDETGLSVDVNAIPDERLVAERMVLDGGGALITISRGGRRGAVAAAEAATGTTEGFTPNPSGSA